MAAKITTPIIEVKANAGNVKPTLTAVQKALAALSGKPLQELEQQGEKSFGDLNDQIKKTVANLYKLKSELGKGADPSKLASQISKQVAELKKASGGKGMGLPSVKDLGGVLDDTLGGKFSLNKGAKFGIAGLIGSLISDTLAGVTDGLVKAKNEGGGFGAYTKAVGDSLPIIGGIVKTVENLDELWSGVRQQAAEYNSLLEQQNKATEYANQSLEKRNKILSDSARLITNQIQAFEASNRGGVVGQVMGIRADRDTQARSLGAQRDDAVAGIEKERDERLKANRDAMAKITDPDQRRKYEGNEKVINQAAEKEIAAQNKAYKDQVYVLDQIASHKALVAQGFREDTKAVEDQMASLEKQTRTMSGDPFEGMIKSFKELKPSAENLAKFTQQVEFYREKLEQVEKEQRKVEAAKTAKKIIETGASLVGLNNVDRQLQELINAGITDKALIARVKVQLETNEAKQIAADLQKRLAGINDSIRLSLAKNIRERIDAEIDAEDRRLREQGGVGMTSTQKDALRKSRLDEEYAKEAAQTRDNAKTPQERLNESIDSLKEQFRRGFLSESQLRSGVGSSLSGYADSIRTNRPELLEAKSAATQQMLAIGTGKVIDASKPELTVARESKQVLTEIRDAIRTNRPVVVSIGG